MRRAFLSAALPVFLLAACATAPPVGGGQRASIEDSVGHSPYGLFLAGEGALNDGRNREAGAYFDRAGLDAGGPAVVRERAFTAAVLAGEIPKAASLLPLGEEASEGATRLGGLVAAVDLMAEGKGAAAREQLKGQASGFPHRSAAALLTPWAAAQAGDVEGSLVRPSVRGDRFVDYVGQLGQAYLFERAKRYDEAETDFKALAVGDAPGELVILAYGAFLERRDRRLDAIALYDKGLEQSPDSLSLNAAKARAVAGKAAPPAPTLRQGAAQALVGPAATLLAAKQEQLALAYIRMVLHLDPKRDDALIMLGDAMTLAGDTEAARAAYSKPLPDSPDYVAARTKLAWTYQHEKDTANALRVARETAATGHPYTRLTLADLLRVNEQYAESAEILTELIDKARKPDWRLHYARGVDYERLNRWPEAERDLETALKLQSDDPELLNYLGYSWIDRGLRLKEALELVEKAVAANPKSGAMVDSLGWAHYRLGDYKKAVEQLEAAVELDAGEPEINDHLGDAYWRVGRKDEAQFQWRRVLTLDPPEKIKASAEAKLKSGLGPDGPAPRMAGQ